MKCSRCRQHNYHSWILCEHLRKTVQIRSNLWRNAKRLIIPIGFCHRYYSKSNLSFDWITRKLSIRHLPKPFQENFNAMTVCSTYFSFVMIIIWEVKNKTSIDIYSLSYDKCKSSWNMITMSVFFNQNNWKSSHSHLNWRLFQIGFDLCKKIEDSIKFQVLLYFLNIVKVCRFLLDCNFESI